MKRFIKISSKVYLTSFLGLGLGAVACSKSDETINHRGKSLAIRVNNEANDLKVGVIGEGSGTLTTLELQETKSEISADFFANIALASKISEDEIIVMGKDGKSWVYKSSEDSAPELLEPVTTPPSGMLYTLPSGNFWIVSAESIGRRKPSTDAAVVKALSFSTSVLPGNKEKMRVLYAGPTDLILHLDTDLVILTVSPDQQILNNAISLASITPKLDGPIVSAGKGSNGSFWFAAGEKLIISEPRGVTFSYTGYHMPTNGHADYKSLAMWLDTSKKGALGDVLMLQADKIWSITGAPVAPVSP